MQGMEQHAAIGLRDRIWLPRWLYWLIPVACVTAGAVGIAYGLHGVPELSLLYGFAVLLRRDRPCSRRMLPSMLLISLLVVPIITPHRVITATVYQVRTDIAVVTAQRAGGHGKTTITSAIAGKQHQKK